MPFLSHLLVLALSCMCVLKIFSRLFFVGSRVFESTEITPDYVDFVSSFFVCLGCCVAFHCESLWWFVVVVVRVIVSWVRSLHVLDVLLVMVFSSLSLSVSSVVWSVVVFELVVLIRSQILALFVQ